MLSEEDVKTIIAADGDQTETYREMYELMNKLKEDNEVTYLSLVVPDEDSVTFYIDTCVESMGIFLRIRFLMHQTFCIQMRQMEMMICKIIM